MKAIAMKCTQQDWEDIKPILEKYKLKSRNIADFNDFNYLTNVGENNNCITNICLWDKSNYNRTVYEEWDKNIFLEACDIIIDDFVLPEKWCLKRTDEVSELISKFFNIDRRHSVFSDWKYIGYDCSSINNGIDAADTPKAFCNGGCIEITFEQFKKYVLKENNMNTRFPFYLSSRHAQQIIDIACNNWKTKLAHMWGFNIALNVETVISEEFYKEMRKACTTEQNKLFDTIFGKDTPKYNYTDGELVWIKNGNNIWELRYTTGKLDDDGLECYGLQNKTGNTMFHSIHKPAPGIILPD